MTTTAVVTVLQSARELAGLTRAELAARAGVALRTIYRIEGGVTRRVTFDTMRRLAAALDVPAERITERVPAPTPDRARPLAPVRPSGSMPAADVLFAPDLARLLRCDHRRLRALLETHPERLPRPLAALDTRPRWARRVVELWMSGDPSAAGVPLEAGTEPEPEPAGAGLSSPAA